MNFNKAKWWGKVRQYEGELVMLGLAAGLAAMFVNAGGGIEGGFWLFLETLPTAAIGLVLYKLIAGDDFRWPKSWMELIPLYLIAILVAGPLVAGAHFLFKGIW